MFSNDIFVKKGIAEGLEDIKAGRVSGPFSSADDVISHLHIVSKTQKK